MSEERETIGDLLKQRRQKLNLTVLQVSAKLKVNPKDIEEIEENFGQSINSNLYLPGFIKAYGKLLDIDHLIIEEKIRSLKIASNTSNKKHQLFNIGENNLLPDRKIVNHATAVFILLFLILLFVYNVNQTSNNVKRIVETYKIY